jgi:ech hydrogenase subunit D
MIEEQPTMVIGTGKLIGTVEELRNDGYRLVQIGCTKTGDTFEINYSFEKEGRFQNKRILIPAETEVPSISGIYWGAFIYENEMHDLFGIQVKGMNIDYRGNLIRTTIRYPFSSGDSTGGDPCQNR